MFSGYLFLSIPVYHTTPLHPAGAEHHFPPAHRHVSSIVIGHCVSAKDRDRPRLPCCGRGSESGLVWCRGRGAVTCLLRFIYFILFYWGTNQVQYSSRREPDVPSIHPSIWVRRSDAIVFLIALWFVTVPPSIHGCAIAWYRRRRLFC